jgi:ABC-type Fe3+-hydroxamate transport system substrate-binding protein
MREIEARTAGLPRPRVMVVAERSLGTGKIENVYVAGSDGFINRMLALAGAQNACPETAAGFPVVSAEGIAKMNADVIIDLVAKQRQAGHSREEIISDWQQLADLEAVRKGRVYLVDEDYAFIPGPRFIRMVKLLARLIHPEVTWPQ